jgi:hypothetical protein
VERQVLDKGSRVKMTLTLGGSYRKQKIMEQWLKIVQENYFQLEFCTWLCAQ